MKRLCGKKPVSSNLELLSRGPLPVRLQAVGKK
jgi:hypothetical protein